MWRSISNERQLAAGLKKISARQLLTDSLRPDKVYLWSNEKEGTCRRVAFPRRQLQLPQHISLKKHVVSRKCHATTCRVPLRTPCSLSLSLQETSPVVWYGMVRCAFNPSPARGSEHFHIIASTLSQHSDGQQLSAASLSPCSVFSSCITGDQGQILLRPSSSSSSTSLLQFSWDSSRLAKQGYVFSSASTVFCFFTSFPSSFASSFVISSSILALSSSLPL